MKKCALIIHPASRITLLMTSCDSIAPKSSNRRTSATSGAAVYEADLEDDDDPAVIDAPPVSDTLEPLSDLRIIWLISFIPTVKHLFLSTEPGKFLQLVHLHLSEHVIPS